MRLCLYGGGVAASLRVSGTMHEGKAAMLRHLRALFHAVRPVDNGDTDDSAAPGVASQRIVGAEIECGF